MSVNNRVSYAALTYTIAAGATIGVEKQSGFITCLNASAAFKIKFDDGSFSDFEAGLSYTPLNGFSRVDLYNPSGEEIEVRLGFGKGQINDARVTISAGQDLNVRAKVPDVLTTGAAVSAVNAAATLLAAANTKRREFMAIAPQDAAGAVYIGGDAGAGAGAGLPLLPGQSVTLETGAAIYCRNDTGAAVAVAVAELEFSL